MSSFPKYYIHKNPEAHWCIVRTDETKCIHAFNDSTDEHRTWGPTHDDMVERGEWIEVSEARAEARRDGFQYAEPPAHDIDEWVEITDPEHVIRACDQLTATANVEEGVSVDNWYGCLSANRLGWVGDKIRTSRDLRVRCRRSDLPKPNSAIIADPPQPPQPLRWVENCKPDKPGIWACLHYSGYIHVGHVDSVEVAIAWNPATRCYLGPIPEILPPLKKVTERLWLLHCGGGLWEEDWVADDDRKTLPADWIRTDRTRERDVQP